MEPHSIWQDEIKRRTADVTSDWWPFVENVNDILERINLLTQRMDSLDNEIGETKGMIKNLRKVLIKLEVVDDRFVF
jgi:peptidoglycan hydrolase CwlO-like protein